MPRIRYLRKRFTGKTLSVIEKAEMVRKERSHRAHLGQVAEQWDEITANFVVTGDEE